MRYSYWRTVLPFGRRYPIAGNRSGERQAPSSIMSYDPSARQALVQDRPIADLDLKSGADLRALIKRAFDLVIEEILKSEDDRALQMTHIRTGLSNMRSATLDWLNRAKNYVEFANQNEFYSAGDRFLRTPEVKKWKI